MSYQQHPHPFHPTPNILHVLLPSHNISLIGSPTEADESGLVLVCVVLLIYNNGSDSSENRDLKVLGGKLGQRLE